MRRAAKLRRTAQDNKSGTRYEIGPTFPTVITALSRSTADQEL
jgi:hypothetical protein